MKKYYIFLSFILFSTCFLNAQETPKKHTHKNRLSIGFMASPDLYIYDFKSKNLDSKPTYKTQLNYSVGGTVIYHPIKFITLRAALMYSEKGYSVDYHASVDKPSIPDTTKRYSLKYLDLPLMINFNLIHKDHIHFYISGGFVPSILVSKGIEYNVPSDSKSDLNNVNNFFAGVSYSIGVKYNLTDWLGCGFEPYFRTYLNNIDKSNIGAKPVSFGGKVSLVINFNHY